MPVQQSYLLARPRTRVRGAYTGGTWKYRSYNGVGQASGTDVWENGTVERMDDVVQSRFNARSEAGEILINPLTQVLRQKIVNAHSYAYVHAVSNVNVYYWYEGYPRTKETHNYGPGATFIGNLGSFVLSQSDRDSAEIEASTRCLSNIGRASTDNWENLYEVEKTLGMLWSPLKSWYRFSRKAKVASLGLSAANAWLMYRYGINPLVRSTNDIMEAAQRILRKERVTTRGKSTASSAKVYTANWTYSPVQFVHSYEDYENIEVRAMSLNEVVYDWKYTYGFDAKSLLTLPWNAIPYSFVADWFFNIADYIGALAESVNETSLGSCLVTRRSAMRKINSVSTSWGPSWVQDTPWNVDLTETLVEKTRIKGLRSPGLVVKQNFRLNDPTRLGDAFALVGQQILQRFR